MYLKLTVIDSIMAVEEWIYLHFSVSYDTIYFKLICKMYCGVRGHEGLVYHRQTVQIQIRCHMMWHLIRVFIVCLQGFSIKNRIKATK